MSDEVALYPTILHRSSPAAWVVMPQFLERVRRFNGEHDARHGELAVDRFVRAFGAGDGSWLGIALLDADGQMRGHLLGCVEVRAYTGVPFAAIWQWEKDVRCSSLVDDHCRHLAEGWARSQGAPRLVALAVSAARVRLFKRHGFRPGPQMITREVPQT